MTLLWFLYCVCFLASTGLCRKTNVGSSTVGGSLVAHGYQDPQLLLGTAANNSLLPVKVMPGWSSNPGSISCSTDYCCGIDASTNSSLWCWGSEQSGELGNGVDGGSADNAYPVKIGTAKWSKVSTGLEFTCAIDENKKLHCWGNMGKALGIDGLTANALIPAKVDDEKWVDIATGLDHACGIHEDGTLWCWGSNSQGQLALGTNGNTVTPLKAVVSGVDTWASVVAGSYHTCAKSSTGAVYCTGSNDSGQLGIGSTDSKNALVQESTGSTWSSIHAADSHSCAIKSSDATMWCWGANTFGEFGLDAYSQYESPTQLDGGSTGWASVTSYYNSVCGLKSSGQRWCAGVQSYAASLFGDGNLYSSKLAFVRIGSDSNWQRCSSGSKVACCVKGGDLYCFGYSDHHQSARPLDDLVYSPSAVVLPDPVVSVGAGSSHTCAVTTTGALYCWGQSSGGEFGNGKQDVDTTYGVPKKSGSDTWKMVSADMGDGFTCGITSNSILMCTGSNGFYQLGLDDTDTRFNFTQVGTDYKYISSGGSTTCGIKTNGSLVCFGYNHYGQTGLSTNGPIYTPTVVGTAIWLTISVGQTSACGIQKDTTLWCSGDNGDGQLGIGQFGGLSLEPSQVGTKGMKQGWSAISVGDSHVCGIRNGQLYCWGNNVAGQLGLTGVDRANYPTRVGTASTWSSVAVGYSFSCATRTSGALYCFGDNNYAELGLGPDEPVDPHYTPTQVTPGTSYIKGFAGSYTFYATK